MDKEKIRKLVKIEKLIMENVALKEYSSDVLSGNCPFCEDRDFSLRVFFETDSFSCKKCRRSGDIFTWQMALDSIEFSPAFCILKEKAIKEKLKKEANIGIGIGEENNADNN